MKNQKATLICVVRMQKDRITRWMVMLYHLLLAVCPNLSYLFYNIHCIVNLVYAFSESTPES
jgi:hypothetical protein